MKALPCHLCIVLPICKNRTLTDTIYSCMLLKEFLYNAKSTNRLYNKINSIFNIKINPQTFKLIVDFTRIEETAMRIVTKNLAKQINKDIINEVLKENIFANFSRKRMRHYSSNKRLKKLLKKTEALNEITKNR